MPKPTLEFPTLLIDDPEERRWPMPPFSWRHQPVPDPAEAQPCRLESLSGSPLDGEMLEFDTARRTLKFRTRADGPSAELAFSRIRRLTLTVPLRPLEKRAGAPIERIPAAAQERDYCLHSSTRAPALTGRTAGHVETADGLYLFTPVDRESGLERVFVPREAYGRCEFGASAEELASSRWISSPAALLDAIERQRRMPVLPLGQSLIELGLITPDQLTRALAEQDDKMPLGESLVAAGMISKADLQTALAHKMGYPLVDLSKFPADPAAISKLPYRMAVGYRAMPLMLEPGRMIVAVDKPARVNKLRSLRAFAEVALVPVLAPKLQIMLALERLSKDVWSTHIADRNQFFATTI